MEEGGGYKIALGCLRRWTRYPAQAATVTISTREGTVEADVIDESFSGIAVEIPDSTSYSNGQEITILYYEFPMPAVIRRIVPRENGRCLIGAEWSSMSFDATH